MSRCVTQQPGLSLTGDVLWVSPGDSPGREALGPISVPITCGSVSLIKTQEKAGGKAPLSPEK